MADSVYFTDIGFNLSYRDGDSLLADQELFNGNGIKLGEGHVFRVDMDKILFISMQGPVLFLHDRETVGGERHNKGPREVFKKFYFAVHLGRTYVPHDRDSSPACISHIGNSLLCEGVSGLSLPRKLVLQIMQVSKYSYLPPVLRSPV